MSTGQRVWLDCDSVDSLALNLSLNCLDVFGISTSYGTYNQHNAHAKMQSNVTNIPVYPGCAHPMDQLTHQDFSNMQSIHDEMKGEKFTLVVCGPHTNTAVLLREFPLLRIEKIIIVGGSSGIGDATPSAEFNIYKDPQATQTVIDICQFSQIQLIMIPLDLTNKCRLTNEICCEIQKLNTCDSHNIIMEFDKIKLAQEEFDDEPPIQDAIAIYYAIQPNSFKTMNIYVKIELESQLSYGRSICDKKNVYKQESNVVFCKDVDMDQFFLKVIQSLS